MGIYRVVQKWHKVYDTIIVQPYITESCSFQQYIWKIFLHDLSQYLNTAVKYSLLLPLAIELYKNSITLEIAVHKNLPLFFFL